MHCFRQGGLGIVQGDRGMQGLNMPTAILNPSLLSYSFRCHYYSFLLYPTLHSPFHILLLGSAMEECKVDVERVNLRCAQQKQTFPAFPCRNDHGEYVYYGHVLDILTIDFD